MTTIISARNAWMYNQRCDDDVICSIKTPRETWKRYTHAYNHSKQLDSLLLDSNLSFGGTCSDHLLGHPFVQGKSSSNSSETRRTCIQLAQHQHWCCLWEATKDVNTLQKQIISYGWRRLFCLTRNDGEMPTRKWEVDVDSAPPNGTTKRKERKVEAQMSIMGPSQSRHTQSRQTASRRTVEAYFFRGTEFSSGSYSRQSKNKPSPAR